MLRLLKQIRELEVDYLILDLGAGTSFNVLDFFLIADQGILAVLPEPTSIENVYRFIKSTFFRRFRKLTREKPIREIVSLAMDQKNNRGIRTPHDLIKEVAQIAPDIGEKMKDEMKGLRPKLVVNQVRCKDDITLGFSMRSACSKYFGIQVEYAGYVEFDDHAWHAAKRRRPIFLEYPSSRSVRGIREVMVNLQNEEQFNMEYLTESALRQ